jgi:hypothetical protein
VRSNAEQYRYERDRLRVTGTSPRGFVSVTRDEKGEISVRLRGGTFGHLTERELADEIRDGLAATLHEYARQSRRLRERLLVASAHLLDPEPQDAGQERGNRRG